MELLAENGAKINTKNKHGKTALHLAVSRGHEEFEKEQLNKDEKTKFTAFFNTIYSLLQVGGLLDETNQTSVSAQMTDIKLRKQRIVVFKMLPSSSSDTDNVNKFTLERTAPVWQSRFRVEEWNAASRTFTAVSNLMWFLSILIFFDLSDNLRTLKCPK